MRIRLIGTPEQVQLALCRLQQVFARITAGDPVPLRSSPGLVRVYVTAEF